MKSVHPFAQLLSRSAATAMVLGASSSMHLWAQGPQLTLAPTLHNGYHITCFGKADGVIDLSVTGGTAPYTYLWTTGATTQDVSNLRAGYISVLVKDAANVQARADMTLTEPRDLLADVVPYEYGNGYNVSCFECFNGSIQVTATNGAPPYTYAWADGPTIEDRTQLGAGNYSVNVTDANGCEMKGSTITLRQPDRTDWTMNGNAGTNPSTQYIGTSDNKDVVFKSYGAERLRLLGAGDIKLFGSTTGTGPLYRDANGILKIGGYEDADPYPCAVDLRGHPYWKSTGNDFPSLCEGAATPVLGTKDGYPLTIITNNVPRLSINSSGKFVYGTSLGTSHGFNIGSDGCIGVLADAQSGIPLTIQGSGDYIQFKRTASDGSHWAIHNGDANETHLAFHFFPGTGDALLNRLVLWNDGKVSIGNVSTVTPENGYVYGLYVEKGLLTEKVKVAISTSSDWSDDVFTQGYKLLPLANVRKFIARHGHLPDVPSADEMVCAGLDVAKTDAMLLRKVEELTLYIMQLEERIEKIENH